MVIIIPCSGCSRKFSQIFPVKTTYCLDCQINISDLEEEARNRGLELGLTLRPEYEASKIVIKTPIEYVCGVAYICFQKFEINSQEMEVDRDVKRKHYTDAFLVGYKKGFEWIRKRIDTHLKVMDELKLEFGKIKSPIYLMYHAKHANFSKRLWDYNLISLVKKFIH